MTGDIKPIEINKRLKNDINRIKAVIDIIEKTDIKSLKSETILTLSDIIKDAIKRIDREVVDLKTKIYLKRIMSGLKQQNIFN